MTEPIDYSRSAPDPRGLVAPERDPVTGHLRPGRRSDKRRSEPDQAGRPVRRAVPRRAVLVGAVVAAVVVIAAAVALAGGGDEEDLSTGPTGPTGADGGDTPTDAAEPALPFELQPTDVVILEDTTYDTFEQAYVDVGLGGGGQPAELARAMCLGDTCELVGSYVPDGLEFALGEPVNERFVADIYDDDECPPFPADISIVATPTGDGEYDVEYTRLTQLDELPCGNGVSLLGARLNATYRWVTFVNPATRAGEE